MRLCMVLGYLLLGGILFAAELEVCETCPYGTIQEAVDAAADGDTITILQATTTEAGIVINGKNYLVIQGLGKDETIVQAAPYPGLADQPVFRVANCINITFRDMTVRFGYARTGNGGGINMYAISTALLENLVLRGNTAEGMGGGLMATVVSGLTLRGCEVYGNMAGAGAGLAFNSCSGARMYHCAVATNWATNQQTYLNGGGILSLDSFLDINNSAIYRNTASHGAGLLNQGYVVRINNSTVSDNFGHGLVNYVSMGLQHVTVVENSGLGLYNVDQNMEITNSVVADNSYSDCLGTISASSANLSGDWSCAGFALQGMDAGMGPLADNGGPTLSHALLPGSAAVDAGMGCGSGTDQRGFARIQGAGCDLGAVETAVDPNAPWALPDAYTIAWDQVLEVPAGGVLDNDGDPNGAPLEAHLLAFPESGNLRLNRDGSFRFRPVIGVSGPLTFVYKAWNGRKATEATVTIQVTEGNHPPVAADDHFEAVAGRRLYVTAPGVLGNDHDQDGDPLVAYLVTPPSVGELGFQQDGRFWYEAPVGFSGEVSFEYKAAEADYRFSDHATVTITVR